MLRSSLVRLTEKSTLELDNQHGLNEIITCNVIYRVAELQSQQQKFPVEKKLIGAEPSRRQNISVPKR